MNLTLPSLLAQCPGGLFLFLLCATLFGYRRRAYLIYWALAWLEFSLWHSVTHGDPPNLSVWAQNVAVVCGSWHAFFWVLGMLGFAAADVQRSAEVPQETHALCSLRLVVFSRFHYLCLVGLLVTSLLANYLLTALVCKAVLSMALAAVYAWSVRLFLHVYRRRKRSGALVAALSLALLAALQLDVGVRHFIMAFKKPAPSYTDYLGFVGLVVEAWTAVSLIVLFLDEEQGKLADALNRLAESQDHFRLVFEHSGVGMALLTGDGRFLQVNPALEQMLGYEDEELLDRRLTELAHHEDGFKRPSCSETGIEVPSSMYERERRYRHKSGRVLSVRVLRVPLRDANRRLRYVVGVFLDITEQRHLEEQLRQAQKMESLGTLVGGIAHDFNNQLTVVLGNLNMALETLRSDDPRMRALADAEQAGQRCADLTQQLLTFSRRQVSQLQPLRLEDLMAEAARLFHRVLPATINVTVEAETDLWAVSADQTQLHQLLMNLAINGRDAMPNGGKLILRAANQWIEAIDCARNVDWRPGKYVLLSVEDTGSGMTPEVQARIFEPFFTTKPVGQGTGLGLAMVFGIVKAHAGWISAASEPGRGSLFRIYLPASEAAAVTTPDSVRPSLRGGHETILVVDDEELIRNLARAILESRGFQVLVAVDGEEALSVYEAMSSRIGLVLLDFTMPKMTGMQVLSKLRRLDPDVRVIFSSGNMMNYDAQELLGAGAGGFVAKPYRAEELVAKIREVLDGGIVPLNGDATHDSVWRSAALLPTAAMADDMVGEQLNRAHSISV